MWLTRYSTWCRTSEAQVNMEGTIGTDKDRINRIVQDFRQPHTAVYSLAQSPGPRGGQRSCREGRFRQTDSPVSLLSPEPSPYPSRGERRTAQLPVREGRQLQFSCQKAASEIRSC